MAVKQNLHFGDSLTGQLEALQSQPYVSIWPAAPGVLSLMAAEISVYTGGGGGCRQLSIGPPGSHFHRQIHALSNAGLVRPPSILGGEFSLSSRVTRGQGELATLRHFAFVPEPWACSICGTELGKGAAPLLAACGFPSAPLPQHRVPHSEDTLRATAVLYEVLSPGPGIMFCGTQQTPFPTK